MSRFTRIVAAPGLAALLLAGCGTLEPAYRRPALPTPAAFPQSAPDAPATPVAAIAWRDFLLDPKLQATVQLALANNRDLRVAIANIEAARAQYRVQRADLLPTVNATGSADYARETAQEAGITTPGGPNHIDIHQYTANVGFSGYELDLFGRVRSLSKAALEQYFSTEEARRAAQITLISEVAGDYLTLAADKAILKAAQDTLASSRASLEVTQARFDHGVASQLDVAQAQTLVQQTRADVANDTTTVAQDENALNLVVGAPVPADLLPGVLGDQAMTLTDLPAGLPSEVLLARPDVVEAEHQLKSANAKIGAARAAFFPSITLTASGGGTSTALQTLFKGASGVWSFTPQVNIPIFAGGANVANLDYAKAERKVYVAQYEKAVQSAFSDVANALARRATIGEQLSANEAATAAAADSLKLSQARYERGSDTYLNVLIAQRTFYGAQQSLIAARLTRAANLVTLYAALGGGGGETQSAPSNIGLKPGRER
jgi:multidrug efflux system outer membrane protein